MISTIQCTTNKNSILFIIYVKLALNIIECRFANKLYNYKNFNIIINHQTNLDRTCAQNSSVDLVQHLLFGVLNSIVVNMTWGHSIFDA